MRPKLILTRAQEASQEFADRVSAQFGEPLEVIVSPALRIEFSESVKLPNADHLIFTSLNGVAWAKAQGVTAKDIWCVGDATAEAADGLGRIHNARGRAFDLIELIRREAPKGPMLHLIGAHQQGDVVQSLAASGFECSAQIVYHQHLNAPSPAFVAALDDTAPLVAPVFSPRSALIFAAPRQAPLHGIAMSGQVAEALIDLGCDTVVTAALPNSAAMEEATLKRLIEVKEDCI